MRNVLIIAPPPTPNGDLHVGHISGPYLAADIYKRLLLQQGAKVSYVVSTDDNQSYVETTAGRLGCGGDELVRRSRAEIKDTFDRYAISLDHYGEQCPEYAKYVTDFFTRLFVGEAIRVKPVDVLYDAETRTYPVEAYVSGVCPHCLEEACGGICEACGHPNACTDLLGLDPARYQSRREPRLVLELEAYRDQLSDILLNLSTHRPALRRLVRVLLAGELRDFVLSYKSPRGLPADFAGLPDQRLNVWGEMLPGHLYFLGKAGADLERDAEYVQFMGFDNSYFYVFVHTALGLAAARCGLKAPRPAAFVTNQFYNLGAAKFSTSKRHLIWARDLASEFNPDLVRLYLALHGPEYQEASFVKEAFAESAKVLAGRINALVDAHNAWAAGRGAAPAGALAVDWGAGPSLQLHGYDAATAARAVLNRLRWLTRMMGDDPSRWGPYIPCALVLCLEPFCPRYAESVARARGLDGRQWGRLVPSGSADPLPRIEIAAHA